MINVRMRIVADIVNEKHRPSQDCVYRNRQILLKDQMKPCRLFTRGLHMFSALYAVYPPGSFRCSETWTDIA